ncbi:catechol 1,2-dioxygenase [Lentzea guizhouensis]|uniref:Catechol 1,2-dioxygenase n=1 Tax=Lentzea guizhouensis TaxID=1586287 RepID=A0A1B2HVW0_9PSEU|nr:dioxygenase [Lentzea guizhouensis]ANZ41843.1 catechol 1,2-dioxygenase [Lentzea guizhouensis]
MTAVETPAAADSGAAASANFRSAARTSVDIPAERVSTVVTAVLRGVHEAIRAHDVTYPEFQAAKQWLMDVGEGGEWPLFLDVFVEHVVEEVAARTQDGTKGTILGPYYLPDQQRLGSVATLPMRPDEQGDPLVFSGRVVDLTGAPLEAELDIWHADARGYYSGFAPGVPDGNLRAVVMTDSDGRFEITTVQPAPYRIPTDGPTGRLVDAAGWHPWRPAHLHLIVRAPGHRPITTQLYFAGGQYVDSDVAEAVKPELVLTPAGQVAEYDFVLEPV